MTTTTTAQVAVRETRGRGRRLDAVGVEKPRPVEVAPVEAPVGRVVQRDAGYAQQQYEKDEHDAEPAVAAPEPDTQPGVTVSLSS